MLLNEMDQERPPRRVHSVNVNVISVVVVARQTDWQYQNNNLSPKLNSARYSASLTLAVNEMLTRVGGVKENCAFANIVARPNTC